MDRPHPALAVLLEEPDSPEVREHLRECARCRIDVRMVGGIERTDPGTLDGIDEARQAFAHLHARAEETLSQSFEREPTDERVVLSPGQAVDRYRVEARIGAGGMGTVYRVRHEHLDSRHALKVMHWTSPAQRRRLFREGRAQGRLRHPNLIPVTDVVDIDGVPGLIMDYVDGPTLAQHLTIHGSPPIDEVDRLGEGILRGVAAAHRAGLVHRDLKPGNVLLARGDEGLVAKVTDFGLVRVTDEVSAATQLTRPGSPMGTPAYMAPEQVRDASQADERSDVFALGAVLYELVTGHRAFPGADWVDVLDQVRGGDYAPLDDQVVDLPPRMARTIDRALQVPPEERFADAGEMRRAWCARAPPGRVGRATVAPALLLAAGLGLLAVAGAIWGLRDLPTERADPAPSPSHRDIRLTGRAHGPLLDDVALSPRGERVAYVDADGLWVQPAARGTGERILAGSASAVDFRDEDTLVVAGRFDGAAGIWLVDVQGGRRRVHDRPVGRLRVSPDGGTLAFVDEGGLWTMSLDEAGPVRIRPLGGATVCSALAWAPSGRSIASVYYSTTMGAHGTWLEITAADGSASRRMLEDPDLTSLGPAALAWLPPDRLVFGRVQGRSPNEVTLHVVDGAEEADRRAFEGAPVLHRVVGALPTAADGSRDGDRIAYLRTTGQKDVFLIPLGEGGEPSPLTRDDWNNSPTGWSTAERVLVVSDRSAANGSPGVYPTGDLYELPLEGSGPSLLAEGPVPQFGAAVVDSAVLFWRLLGAPDDAERGRALYRLDERGEERELVRFEVAPEGVRRGSALSVRCAVRVERCLVGVPETDRMEIRPLDPTTGALGDVALDAPPSHAWGLAPDGRRVAVAAAGRVSVHDLASGTRSEQAIGLELPQAVTWDPAGEILYVTGMDAEQPDAPRYQVLEIELGGEVRELWTSPSWWLFAPSPSPDGRFLAVGAFTFDSDVWLLDGLQAD